MHQNSNKFESNSNILDIRNDQHKLKALLNDVQRFRVCCSEI